MTKEKIKEIDSALLSMVCMAEDRLSTLQEKEDFGDEFVRKDLKEQIAHFQACKRKAEKARKTLKKLVIYS